MDELVHRMPAEALAPSRDGFDKSGCCKTRDEAEAMVFILDGDVEIRFGLQRLMKSVQLQSRGFVSPIEFLSFSIPDVPSCLILDVRLPELSGLELQRQLARRGVLLPMIFITSYGDIQMCVSAMRSGAVDFLTRPCRDQDVLDAVMIAVERDRARRRELDALRSLRQRCETLTRRELEVMPRVAAGMLNKQIAADLGLSEVTVKVYRAGLMRKLDARSLPELVRMVDALDLTHSVWLRCGPPKPLLAHAIEPHGTPQV